MLRFLRWLRGEEGWLTLILLTFLALLPVTAFQDANWLDDSQSHLSRAALFGAWFALLLARTRVPSIVAFPAGLAAGGTLVFAAVGGALPPAGTVLARVGPFWDWVQLTATNKPHGPDPLSPLFWEAVRQTGFLADRFAAWGNTAAAGGTSSDNLVFLVMIAVVLWVGAYISGWALYRWHSPLAGVLPPGIFVLVNVFLANQGWGYMAFYLASALVLLITFNLLRMRRNWQASGIDYADDLPFDVALAGALLAVALVFFTLPLPGVTSNPVARAWWNTLSSPWGEVETTVNRLFSGINNPNQGLGAGARSSLVLGGSFDPRAETPVFMYVTTDEVLPDIRELRELGEEPIAPAHYWRGLTFDTYNGRGWQNTERVNLDRAAGQAVIPVTPLGFKSLVQTVELVQPRVDLVYATNQPVTVSLAYRVQAMGADDYSSLTVRDLPLTTIRYTVRSLVPNLGEEDLRAAPTDYPAWVTKRYLQLPTSLPARVTDLSKQITAGIRNPYDKALAVQEYLRKLPYDPQILLPSGDFDAVDYFLFLQKGYCDYFGTTMAVMLRAAGVPARVARGYLPGDFEWSLNRYTVRENRAHVWTEVYFPPYGWIEFEPTPGQRAIIRPPGSTLGAIPEPTPVDPVNNDPEETPLGDLGDWGTLLAGLGLAGLAALLVWTIYPAWENRLTTGRYAELIYGRMMRYAAWGAPRHPSSRGAKGTANPKTPVRSAVARTPMERATALAGDLQLMPTAPEAGATSPAEPARAIAAAYQAAAYGPVPLDSAARPGIRQSWLAIKPLLWARVFSRRLLRRR